MDKKPEDFNLPWLDKDMEYEICNMNVYVLEQYFKNLRMQIQTKHTQLKGSVMLSGFVIWSGLCNDSIFFEYSQPFQTVNCKSNFCIYNKYLDNEFQAISNHILLSSLLFYHI